MYSDILDKVSVTEWVCDIMEARDAYASKKYFFSYVVLASRAKVGQRAEETKNDLREGFKIFSPGIALQLV